MLNRTIIPILVVLAVGEAAIAAGQQAISAQTLREYLDKMGLRYVPHPKNADALVVPRSENRNAERLDLYVELRRDKTLVLTVYPRLNGKYFNLDRATDREALLARLLEANHRGFAAFFADPQGDVGARFTFTTEGGITYESFRAAVTELLRIADEYTPTLGGYMRKDQQ